ncbi:beta-lactamase regulator AmpE [Thalassotalea sp. ND16A]|uniref:beta-lactamase regulator AmpE n=1 Tax=Thalassotalea sp. ND16A TaxID=1535422 RepID=UPI00051A290A|nr:beta-lactamase regulator AmpE [Thalassotalea sp. ND16A]KGK01145.1 signaling modulator of AmpD, AmpE [Thalassotalea sp. ND16A]
MSLISLLIALAAERVLRSKHWHFNFYYAPYLKFARGFVSKGEISKSSLNVIVLALIPAILVWGLIALADNLLIEFVISAVVLIVCLGCSTARESYKNFLNAAMRGDEVAVSHHQMELQQNQDFDGESFGQTLVWLNYQYYMAIMLVFVFAGIGGVVFYRLLVAIANNIKNEQGEAFLPEAAVNHGKNILFYIDIIPSRVAAFGYMLVGHFSKASTIWLEGLLNFQLSPRKYLCTVAKTSEEYVVNNDDLTAEPTLLVRLAKRNVLLLLAATAFMTIAGVLH